jgi:hypothetical protein
VFPGHDGGDRPAAVFAPLGDEADGATDATCSSPRGTTS